MISQPGSSSQVDVVLSQPRRKRFCYEKPAPPLPLVKISDDEIKKFKGKLIGCSVVIEDDNENMRKFISMGYFGKGNFSRSFPTFAPHKYQTEIIRNRQFERRKNWVKKFGKSKHQKKCIVVPDSDSENEDYFVNLKPKFELDELGLKETIHLLLEEAFFLTHFVKCLEINYNNKQLTGEDCWNLFQELNTSFVLNYIVYHFYRGKKWVVKPGEKYGVLYKQGPPFYHASYVVIIDVIDENCKRIESKSRRSMNMLQLQGLNRACEAAAKELLIARVVWPCGLESITIDDIKKFEIQETLMTRWIPSVERTRTEEQSYQS